MRIKILHSFWDFNINPISYDIIWFLCAVDHYAINNSYDGFKIHFIPEVDEPNRKYPEQFDKIIDLESRRFRKRNICYQSLSLFKNCKGFHSYTNYDEAIQNRDLLVNTFPKNDVFPLHDTGKFTGHWEYFKYVNDNINFNNDTSVGIKISTQSDRYIKNWFAKNKIDNNKAISLTLRQLNFDVDRNNNLNDWLKFANYLKERSYVPILFPDSDHIFDYYDYEKDHICSNEFAFNVELRAAFYENCKNNFFVSSGPAALAQLNPKCSYVVTNIVNEGSPGTAIDFMKQQGFSVGKQPKFCKKNQFFYWDKDNFEVLKEYFEKFKEK